MLRFETDYNAINYFRYRAVLCRLLFDFFYFISSGEGRLVDYSNKVYCASWRFVEFVCCTCSKSADKVLLFDLFERM